jgi:hypothetical protein
MTKRLEECLKASDRQPQSGLADSLVADLRALVERAAPR